MGLPQVPDALPAGRHIRRLLLEDAQAYPGPATVNSIAHRVYDQVRRATKWAAADRSIPVSWWYQFLDGLEDATAWQSNYPDRVAPWRKYYEGVPLCN